MSLFHTGHRVERSTPAAANSWDWLAGAALLTSLALATIGWCYLLALALWKALQWVFVEVSEPAAAYESLLLL